MRLIITRPNYSFDFIKFTYESPEKLTDDLEKSATELGSLERKRRYLKVVLNANYNVEYDIGLTPEQFQDMHKETLQQRKLLTEKVREIKPIKSECGKRELAQNLFLDLQGNYIKPKIYSLEEWFDKDK